MSIPPQVAKAGVRFDPSDLQLVAVVISFCCHVEAIGADDSRGRSRVMQCP